MLLGPNLSSKQELIENRHSNQQLIMQLNKGGEKADNKEKV